MFFFNVTHGLTLYNETMQMLEAAQENWPFGFKYFSDLISFCPLLCTSILINVSGVGKWYGNHKRWGKWAGCGFELSLSNKKKENVVSLARVSWTL